MSEIRDRAEKQIIYILDVWHNLSKEDTEGIKWRRYFIDQILSIKELAIVDREAELPQTPSCQAGHGRQEAYRDAQKDMRKEGWVKEIKDD